MRPPADQPEQEKPYDFVPFVARKDVVALVGHDRWQAGRLSGRVDLVLVTKQAVQVASGAQDFVKVSGGDVLVLRQAEVWRRATDGHEVRRYVLPGSSLKGAVRSLVEAITASCVVVATGQVRPSLPRSASRCADTGQLCPACRLFGMSGAAHQNYQGRVTLEDVTVPARQMAVVRVPLLWAPARTRGGLPGRYKTRDFATGRKFYKHFRMAAGPDARMAVVPGTELVAHVHFENLTEAELGLLLAALGQHPAHRFLIKVGAGKPIGMGSVEVRLQSVWLAGAIAETGRLGAGGRTLADAELATAVEGWLAAAMDGQPPLVDPGALSTLAGIYSDDNLRRDAPSGMY